MPVTRDGIENAECSVGVVVDIRQIVKIGDGQTVPPDFGGSAGAGT